MGTGDPLAGESGPTAEEAEAPAAAETSTQTDPGALDEPDTSGSPADEDATPPAALDVTGPWIGSLEGDTAYLELTQTGSYVSGKFCEAPPDRDCHPIFGGRFIDGHLTGAFSFFDSGTQTVSFDLAMGGDGKTLSGDAEVTKCSCTASVVLARAKQ